MGFDDLGATLVVQGGGRRVDRGARAVGVGGRLGGREEAALERAVEAEGHLGNHGGVIGQGRRDELGVNCCEDEETGEAARCGADWFLEPEGSLEAIL